MITVQYIKLLIHYYLQKHVCIMLVTYIFYKKMFYWKTKKNKITFLNVEGKKMTNHLIVYVNICMYIFEYHRKEGEGCEVKM